MSGRPPLLADAQPPDPSAQPPAEPPAAVPSQGDGGTGPSSRRKSTDERKELLSRALQTQVADGHRIESQGDYNAVVVKGHPPNHVLHLILTILTGGVWGLLVWLPIVIFCGEKRRMVTVDEFGSVLVQKV